MNKIKFFSILFVSPILIFVGLYAFSARSQETQPVSQDRFNLLRLLNLTPSPQSIDYVMDKTQFQLHTLLTEQRHPKTWNLSERIQKSCTNGLRMLLSVDEDIVDLQGVIKGVYKYLPENIPKHIFVYVSQFVFNSLMSIKYGLPIPEDKNFTYRIKEFFEEVYSMELCEKIGKMIRGDKKGC